MDEVFPSHYQVLYSMIAAKTRDTSTTNVLELGCSNGHFVEYLRQQGYNAEGVDGNKRTVEAFSSRQIYLHHGELTSLEDVFGERQFDLIVAKGVFSKEAQLDYKYPWSGALVIAFSSPEERKKEYESLQETINQILRSVYGQLAPGGFLVIHENTSEGESVDFSRETVEDIGYIVEQLEKQQAILQKPY